MTEISDIAGYVDYPVADLLAVIDPARELRPCGLQRLLLGSGAVGAVTRTVGDLLAVPGPDARVVVLTDAVEMTRTGGDLKAQICADLAAQFDVQQVVLDDGHPELHVVDEIIADAITGIDGAAAVVAVGGGTISDIAKLAVAQTGSSLVTVQTAASVDGYTDDVSVLLRDGVKRTVPSRWPDAVIGDAEAIAEAPTAMNRAGFGEMTSMLTAPADWRLANLVGVDSTFCEGPIRLLDMVGGDLAQWAPGVAVAEPKAVAALTRALALRGIATGIAGTTAVLSGVEHLVSHMLDAHHAAVGAPIGLHGAQVGAATPVAAAAWEMLADRLATHPGVRPQAAALDADAARNRVDEAFGHLGPDIAAECWNDYSRKLATIGAALPQLSDMVRDWDDHEPDLRRLVRPSVTIGAALHSAGAATGPADLTPHVDADLWRWAVANCALMRNRFTVIDLLTLLGWWTPADVDEVFARVASAVPAGAVR